MPVCTSQYADFLPSLSTTQKLYLRGRFLQDPMAIHVMCGLLQANKEVLVYDMDAPFQWQGTEPRYYVGSNCIMLDQRMALASLAFHYYAGVYPLITNTLKSETRSEIITALARACGFYTLLFGDPKYTWKNQPSAKQVPWPITNDLRIFFMVEAELVVFRGVDFSQLNADILSTDKATSKPIRDRLGVAALVLANAIHYATPQWESIFTWKPLRLYFRKLIPCVLDTYHTIRALQYFRYYADLIQPGNHPEKGSYAVYWGADKSDSDMAILSMEAHLRRVLRPGKLALEARAHCAKIKTVVLTSRDVLEVDIITDLINVCEQKLANGTTYGGVIKSSKVWEKASDFDNLKEGPLSSFAKYDASPLKAIVESAAKPLDL